MSESNKKSDIDNESITGSSSEDKTSIVRGGTFTGQIEKAARIPPSLVVLVGPPGYIGRQWAIEEEDIIIGRSMTSSIFVNDKSVSKSHSKLNNSNGAVTLVDLESTNKTIINGRPIPPFVPVRLHNNDQIKVGNVLFKFLEQGSLEAVANQELNTKSQKDPLTGIWNKGALLAQGPEIFQRARLLGVALSLIVFDIDHFKPINDNYSHEAGDHILKELTQVIKRQLIRGDDFFARFGGEEFVIALFGSTLAQAQEIAERIRHTVEVHLFEYQDQTIPVTISMGLAVQKPDTADWGALFREADDALYESKRSGRNRVTVSAQSRSA